MIESQTTVQRSLGHTILLQLGGSNRLRAMLGVNHFIMHDDGLSFRFKAGRSFNHIRITLNHWDLYDVEVCLLRRGVKCNIKTAENVYNDGLIERCESLTGLAFRL